MSNRSLYEAEYHTHEPRVVTNGRASQSQLTDKEVVPFKSIDFIDGKDWLPIWV